MNAAHPLRAGVPPAETPALFLPAFPPIPASAAWGLPPADLALADDAVHVWRAALDVGALRLRRLAALLSAEERDRAARYRFERDRRRFVAARGQLRLVLSRYLQRPPGAIALRYGARGKPAVDALEFNVSHGGGLALYAVARSRRVGVDVEPVRVIADADGLVDRFFSVGEGAAYRALPAADRPAAFAACWTRKEAFVKALGDGLSYPLDAFDVTVGPDRPAALLRLGGDPAAAARWRLRALPVGAGYAATVAAEAPPCHLLCLDASARARREPTALPLPT